MARPAARLRRIVGPLASRHTVPYRTVRAAGETAHHRIEPDISGYIRICPSSQIDEGKKGSSRAVWSGAGSHPVWLVACGRARRVRYRRSPDRILYGSSHAGSPLAEHGVGNGRRVPYDPSPDRVPYDPSPDRVSSYFCPCRRPRSLCRGHGRAIRTSVACHAPAQQPPVADAARSGLRTSILMYGRGVLVWPRRRRG